MVSPIHTKKHYNTPGHAHELTCSCYRRKHLFLDETACNIFMEEISRTKKKHDLKIWAYVIMPNHYHLLVWPVQPQHDISTVNRDMRSVTALRYIKHVRQNNLRVIRKMKTGKDGELRFWQHGGGFDRNMWNALAIHNAISYIEANPVRAGLVKKPEEWKWGSAHARKTQQGFIPDLFQIPHLMRQP